MLFSALLLITWGSLLVSTTSLLSSSKEIQIQIPAKKLSTSITENSSEINPSLFFNSKESMITSPYRSRHSLKVSDSRKVSKNTRSSVNPNTGNVDPKVLRGGGITNPLLGFRSYLGGGDIPFPTSMNNPSQDNGKEENKMMHLSHSRDLGDQHMKQVGDGNNTFLDDDDYYYSSSPPPEKTNAFSKNDSVSHLFQTEFRELQIFPAEKNADKYKKETSTSLYVPFTNAKSSLESRKKFSNETFISQNPQEGENVNNTALNLNPNERFTSEKMSNDYPELSTHSTENVLKHFEEKETLSQLYNESKGNIFEASNERRNILNPDGYPKGNELNNNTEKTMVTAKSPPPENSSNIIDISAMQRDGIFESYTKTTELYSYTSHNYYNIDKLRDEKSEIHKKEVFSKNSPTTPDSHMNDPPFRGPNVPSDIDNFYIEKDESKIEFRNPHSIVEAPSYQSLNLGEEWKNAKTLGRIAWDYHCYVTGSMFAIIAIYSFVSLLRMKSFITLLRTGYYITINSIIFVTCILRAFYLLYDPYNFLEKLPVIVSQILLSITVPSLTSCFCFLVLALMRFTKTKLFSHKYQNPSVLAIIIIFIMSLIVTLQTIVHLLNVPNIFLILCYLIIIVFGSFSSISYFVVFNRLHHRALRKQGEMIRLTFTKMHIDGAQLPKKLPRPTLGLAVKLVLVISVFQILLCCLIPYSIVYLQDFFPAVQMPNPWLWWSYQLLCRILELIMCGTMSFIATQPLRHFEVDENRFCKILMWFPCSSFADCFQHEEVVDFEAHSNNYANPQGLRNPGLNLIGNSRRLQTNSLPTFRTPLTDVDTGLPMRTLPCNGRHTNHASALSLLSYYRSKRALNMSKTEDLDNLERTLCNQSASSSDARNMFRPASMLYKDNGFIRFRRETDPEQPMEMSDEDDHLREELDTSIDDADSTKANVGSSFHSLLEGDIVQNALSPFFQIDYKRRFRKMSRVSIETTDYSADVSSDQLSNVVNLRNGLSTSALDFQTRKYGSTCSSESAANSFDVTFFLNSNSSPTSPVSTTPASLNIFSAYRSETEDDKTSSVEGHEVMLRSVSPIVKQASFGRLSLNLNLHASSQSNGHVNVACGTEDITPDSAVYLDLHLPRDKSPPRETFDSHQNQNSGENSFLIFNDDIAPLTPDIDSPYMSPTSQSLNEIQTSKSYVIPRFKKNSRGFLCKLRGSTFSLNAAIYGYEPLEHETPKNSKNRKNRNKLERSSSDRRPLSDGHLETKFSTTSLAEIRNRSGSSSSGHLGDSGLLGDCGVALVDVASQTEDTEETYGIHKSYSLITNTTSKCTKSQTQNSAQLLDFRKCQ